MNSADRVVIRPLNQHLNFLLYIYYSNYMSGINTHYKPAVPLTYFSPNVSLGCLLELLVVLITQLPHHPWAWVEPQKQQGQEWGIGETGNREGPKADVPALDKAGLVEFPNLSHIFLLHRLRISKPRYNTSCPRG